MDWKLIVECVMLTPFVLLFTAFFIYETAQAMAYAKRNGRK